MANVIEISGLVKNFGSTRALDGLDLTVEEGDVHGFLGPNGSGKSTTIRILLGLLRPNGGQATMFGKDPWHDATALHEHISYVPGDVSLWPQLTGGEVIDLLARLRGDLDPKRRDELIERFELDPRKKTRTYSKGNRQKVALVAGLASDAELMLLDEPTSGLDPLMEGEFQKCVREMRDEGRTILLSSHILAEVEALCETVSIIRLGRTVETGSLDELRGLTHTAVIATTREPLDGVGDLPGVTLIDHHNHTVRLDVESEHLEETVAFLSTRKLTSLESHPPTLEELFLRSYGDTIPEQDE